VILAHHGGEAGVVLALASVLGASPLVLALARWRLGDLVDRLRRRT
jgi:hypothetical protein